ncbi:MAG: hypothetical protein IT324_20135 [Anaerolineae bacterium]|nr:hypothetical protein [Anaerolineae bacterium]
MNQPDYNARYELLPAWMRPRRHVIDWGLLIVLAFALLIILPLVIYGGLPVGTNADLYALRSQQVDLLVKSGTLFSRWSPDFNYGLGSPLFNYLPPLSYYLPGYHQAITETGPAESTKVFLGLSVMAAGSGMYVFARQRWNARGGLIAALVYLFSQPLAQTLPFAMGDLALLMALGLLPWSLWAVDTLRLAPNRNTFLITVGLLTAFLLTDMRMAWLSIALFLVVIIAPPNPMPARHYRPLIDVGILVLLITAFFWLPALTERDQIRWLPTAVQPLAGAGNPISAIGSGAWLLMQIGIAALVVYARWNGTRLRADALLLLTVGLTLVALALPGLEWLWPAPTVFQAVQPYHGLLVATFCLAALSGQAACLLDLLRPRWQLAGLIALCLFAPLVALPTLLPPAWQSVAIPADWLSRLQVELSGSHTGSFRNGVLLPSDAPGLPLPSQQLTESFERGLFDWVSRRAYSSDSQLNAVEHGPLGHRYLMDMAAPSEVEFYILNYPGWTASLNGLPQSLQSSPQGLITMLLPRTSGELVVTMQGTPIRYASWIITFLGIVMAFILWRRQPAPEPDGFRLSFLAQWEAIGLGLALICYAGVVILIHR